jgi:hypothetical protein
MPKKTQDVKPKKSLPEIGEPSPPQLSEKLIAQLQGAVSAALRKRMSEPSDAGPAQSKRDF